MLSNGMKKMKKCIYTGLNDFLLYLKTHKDLLIIRFDIQNQSIELINNGEITSLSQGGKSFQ